MVHGVSTKEYHPKTACAILGSSQKKRYFYISSTSNTTMPFLKPIVSTNNDGVKVIANVNNVVELLVKFQCIETGTTLVTITLPLRPNEQDATDDSPIDGPVDLSFSFAKKCRNAEDQARKSS